MSLGLVVLEEKMFTRTYMPQSDNIINNYVTTGSFRSPYNRAHLEDQLDHMPNLNIICQAIFRYCLEWKV